MSEKYARLFFLLPLLLLTLVGLNVISLNSDPSEQTDTKIAASLQGEKGEVLPGSTSTYYYKFYLKDASVLGAVLPGSTSPDGAFISGANIAILNQSSFHCGDSGSNYTFEYYSGLYKLICQEAGTMQLEISNSGYETKYVSLAYYQGEISTITLSKYIPPPPPTPETIKDVKLPNIFSQSEGTTDLSKISDPAKVNDLTLGTKKALIKFKEAVDLSSDLVRDKFKTLDKYVNMDATGIVGLDSVALPNLNKKANVQMKGLPWLEQPRVLVNGKEDKKIVSNISYSKGVLSFDVTSFSTFKAAPTVRIEEPANNFQAEKSQVILRGKVTDPTASVSATLNNKNLGNLKVATTSGKFITNLNLVEGINKVVINALSANGATASAKIAGTFIPASEVNSLVIYLVLGLLTLIALVAMVYYFVKNKVSSPLPKNQGEVNSLPKQESK